MLRYVTTALEIVAAALLTASGWLFFGLAGALAVAGGVCLAASYALTRGSA